MPNSAATGIDVNQRTCAPANHRAGPEEDAAAALDKCLGAKRECTGLARSRSIGLTAVPAAVVKVRSIERLYLDHSRVADPSFVSGLGRRANLDQTGTRVTDLSPLAGSSGWTSRTRKWSTTPKWRRGRQVIRLGLLNRNKPVQC